MSFSSRLPDRLTPNRVSGAVAQARAGGQPLADLTETNPTVVGLSYPTDLTAALADAGALIYEPSPLGLARARAAVARTYPGFPPDRVVLTASTSEAYSHLFKLLCDAGDEVLVPRPSYPLFEHLTRLDNVREAPYRLDRDAAWRIDRTGVERACSSRTRAVLVVSPNNPTGSRIDTSDREWLVGFARARGLAIISDEVFADYHFGAEAGRATFVGEDRVLTFVLGGLSKSAGLPQMKLGWILANGPGDVLEAALERLALIADSYLSVATPVQMAAGRFIELGRGVRAEIQARLCRNRDRLVAAGGTTPALTTYPPEGGWSAVVQVPAILSDDELVLRLVERYGVIVHPGYFFDLDRDGFLVVSLLPRPEEFDRGVAAIAHLVAEAGC